MTEKGTPSETPRIEHLPSGLAMLCRPNGGCRPATKEELFFDSENSRLRDELEKKTAALEKWAKDKHAAALVQCVPPTAVWSYHRVLKDIMADLNAALQPEEEDKHE